MSGLPITTNENLGSAGVSPARADGTSALPFSRELGELLTVYASRLATAVHPSIQPAVQRRHPMLDSLNPHARPAQTF
jgi:hypothetical protein